MNKLVSKQFRFEDLEIWKASHRLSIPLFKIAQTARDKQLYRLAEQLEGATLSISNNIAEGSGAATQKEFARYLSIARASLFEVANILCFFLNCSLISQDEKNSYYSELYRLSIQIYYFRKTLLTPKAS